MDWFRPIVRATDTGSLWNAYKCYEWRERNFDENQAVLDRLQRELRQAVQKADEQAFVAAAKGVEKWGWGRDRLSGWPNRSLHQFVEASRLLGPATADTNNLKGVTHTARWSKLYSLMLDGFVIYDSRVSAVMVSLVERHCKQMNLRVTPKLLSYVRTPARGGPNLPNQSDRQRSESNLWTSWVLGEVCHEGEFGRLSARVRVRAIEAALFMVHSHHR